MWSWVVWWVCRDAAWPHRGAPMHRRVAARMGSQGCDGGCAACARPCHTRARGMAAQPRSRRGPRRLHGTTRSNTASIKDVVLVVLAVFERVLPSQRRGPLQERSVRARHGSRGRACGARCGLGSRTAAAQPRHHHTTRHRTQPQLACMALLGRNGARAVAACGKGHRLAKLRPRSLPRRRYRSSVARVRVQHHNRALHPTHARTRTRIRTRSHTHCPGGAGDPDGLRPRPLPLTHTRPLRTHPHHTAQVALTAVTGALALSAQILEDQALLENYDQVRPTL